jgi:hypothetical protein
VQWWLEPRTRTRSAQVEHDWDNPTGPCSTWAGMDRGARFLLSIALKKNDLRLVSGCCRTVRTPTRRQRGVHTFRRARCTRKPRVGFTDMADLLLRHGATPRVRHTARTVCACLLRFDRAGIQQHLVEHRLPRRSLRDFHARRTARTWSHCCRSGVRQTSRVLRNSGRSTWRRPTTR